MSVQLGWSKNPNAKVNWNGGLVSGIVAPDRADANSAGGGERAAGLETSADRRFQRSQTTIEFYAHPMVLLRGFGAAHLWARAAQAVEG